MTSQPPALTSESLAIGLNYLVKRDADLDGILKRWGPPPLWTRAPGFPTLLHIILEQQVSLASAKATYDRLLTVADPLTPGRFLELADEALKTAGFSRQKMAYGRHLAQALVDGQLDLAALERMSNDDVYANLTAIKGIGPWTASIYLLMALGRPDVWPGGDLALAVAVQQVKNLPTRPSLAELTAIAEPWRPWRAVAARLLWHHYLSQ